MNFTEFAKDVHANAVNHGWWETARPVGETMALIHSEWSEALEEYRADRPMVWHKCKGGLNEIACDGHTSMDTYDRCMRPEYKSCKHYVKKPEGIAVELIDGCIRILDFLVHEECMPGNEAVEKAIDENCTKRVYELPELVAVLHWATAISADIDYLKNRYPERMRPGMLIACIGMVFNWIEAQGLDPVEIIIDKHEYNKGRSYRHGGKKA